MGYDLSWTADETPVFGEEDRKTLDLICAQVGVPGAMVAKLLDVEKDLHAMSQTFGCPSKDCGSVGGGLENKRSDRIIGNRGHR